MVDQKYQNELAEFDQVEAGLSTLAQKAQELPSVETSEGYKAHKAFAKDLQKRRTTADKMRLDLTKPHRDFVKEVNDRGNGIVDRIKLIEEPVKDRIKEVDEREERERERRHAELREKIAANITALEEQATGAPSGDIASLLEQVERLEMTGYYDLSKEALDEQARVTHSLQAMFDRAVEQETVAAEREALRREREELEALRRQQAEQAQPEAEPEKFPGVMSGSELKAQAEAIPQEDKAPIEEVTAQHVCRLLVDAFDSGELGCSSPYLEHIIGLARGAAQE